MEGEEYIAFQAPPLCLIVALSSSETLTLDGNDNKYHALDCLNELSQGTRYYHLSFRMVC